MLSLLGLTDSQMADVFEVAESTFALWKVEHPEFSESIKRGKAIADGQVAASLYSRAVGAVTKAEKVFMTEDGPVKVDTVVHHPPDTGAAFIWLKNRQPELWRDRREIEATARIETTTTEELDRIRAFHEAEVERLKSEMIASRNISEGSTELAD